MVGSFSHRWHALAVCLVMFLLLASVSCGSGSPVTTRVPTSTSNPLKQRPGPPPVSVTAQGVPTSPPAPRAITPLLLSNDPYIQGQHQTEVEPGAYTYGSTIVTAFQAGRYSDDGSANIGWATSNDGGLTWRKGFLPRTTRSVGGSYDRITDPTVTYDDKHETWMIASVAFVYISGGIAAPAVLVNLSTDGGLTWSVAIAVYNVGFKGYLDKDWIDCDNSMSSPYFGYCYAVWDDYDQRNLMEMSTSQDGGKSWGSVKTTPDSASGLDAGMLIQPNGRVVVSVLSQAQTAISVYTSIDGGASWSNSITITHAYSYPAYAYYQDHILLSTAIDGAGELYFVWVDCRFESSCRGNDLVMTTSMDAQTWQPVHRIPVAPVGTSTTYYINGLGADAQTSGRGAHLGLTFYSYAADCGNSCPLSVSFIASVDGGMNWSAAKKLAGPMYASWLPQGNNKVGDYISTVFADGRAFPIFEIAQAPGGGHLNEAMYTIAGGLQV